MTSSTEFLCSPNISIHIVQSALNLSISCINYRFQLTIFFFCSHDRMPRTTSHILTALLGAIAVHDVTSPVLPQPGKYFSKSCLKEWILGFLINLWPDHPRLSPLVLSLVNIVNVLMWTLPAEKWCSHFFFWSGTLVKTPSDMRSQKKALFSK